MRQSKLIKDGSVVLFERLLPNQHTLQQSLRYELNMIGRHMTLHALLNIDHNMIQPYKYLMYKILSLFAKFNPFVKLIHKTVYKNLFRILFMSV